MPSIFWATFSLGSLVQRGLAGGQRAAGVHFGHLRGTARRVEHAGAGLHAG